MTPDQAKDIIHSIRPMLRQPVAPDGYTTKTQVLYGPGSDGEESVCFSCIAVPISGLVHAPMYRGKTESFPLSKLTSLADMEKACDLIVSRWVAMVDAPWIPLDGAVHEKSLTPAPGAVG